MWLSKHLSDIGSVETASIGPVTMGGEYVGVLDGGEKRGVPVFSPGGYFWRPEAGDSLLVIKCRDNETCAVGRDITGSTYNLSAGEVLIKSAGGASILLKNDGNIILSGNVDIQGGLSINGAAIA